MRKIRTQSDARGYRDLKVNLKTTRAVSNRRLPPRTAEHIRHAHTLKGIREIPRVGWMDWEPVVAETLRALEKQRFDRANRYYSAVERIRILLDAVRKRSEELEITAGELTQTSTHLQTLMDAMMDILITTDVEGRITDVNRAAVDISGYGAKELVGRPFAELFDEPELAQKGFQQALSERHLVNYELVMIARGQGRVPVSYNANALQNAQGQIIGVLFNARDITALKEAEEAMLRQAEELRRSNAELEQFAYVASHDLQEPLRKIQTFSDMLQEALPPEAMGAEARDCLDRVMGASGRMRVLINDLLTFSRITTRRNSFAPVNLNAVVQTVLSDLEVSVKQAGAQVVVGRMPTIEADATQMHQLFQNLISNALKFLRPGVAPVVEISASIVEDVESVGTLPHSPMCQISVKDNGIGFDEKYLDRIFVVFQRLHGREQFEGTGVGLAVCRKIADHHGGRIFARSAPGKGATFVALLPVKQQVKREEPA